MLEIQRRRPPDDRNEVDIITGMIISDEFLSGIRPLWRPGLFRLPWTERVARWCVEFYDSYQSAPRRQIETLFQTHTRSGIDPGTITAIETFLTGVSEHYARSDNFNVRYQLDRAEQHLRSEALNRLRDGVAVALTSGSVEEAERMVGEFTKIRREDMRPHYPLIDPEPAVQLLQRRERMDGLVKMPGLVGRELGMLDRGQLWAILGETGAGKSWWLQMLGLLGAQTGYNVVRFDFEMTAEQHALRVAIARTGRPDPVKAAAGVLLPMWDCFDNINGQCRRSERTNECRAVLDTEQLARLVIGKNAPPGYSACVACRGSNGHSNGFKPWPIYRFEQRPAITSDDIRHRAEVFRHRAGATGHYVVKQYPSGSMTVSDVRTVLKNLEYYEGITPDVIITDYADKMTAAAEDGYRHKLREIWEGHKAWAQEFNALVITASQSNTVRSGREIRQDSWGEAISKAELIDGGFAIIQNADDRRRQLYRCLNLKQRHDEFEAVRKVAVLSCLKIGRPYVDSDWSWEGLEPEGRRKR